MLELVDVGVDYPRRAGVVSGLRVRWEPGEVIGLLRRIHEEGAALVLMTTRLDVARQVGGRIVRIEDGKFLDEHGQPLGPIETGRGRAATVGAGAEPGADPGSA